MIEISIRTKLHFVDDAQQQNQNDIDDQRSVTKAIDAMFEERVLCYRIACAKLFRIGSIPSTLRISFTLAFFSRINVVNRMKYLRGNISKQ